MKAPGAIAKLPEAWLRRYSIAQRQLIVYCVLLLLVVGQLVFLLITFNSMMAELQATMTYRRPVQRVDFELIKLAAELPDGAYRAIGSNDQKIFQNWKDHYQQDRQTMLAKIDEAEKLVALDLRSTNPDGEQAQYVALRAALDRIDEVFERAFAFHAAGKTRQALFVLEQEVDSATFRLDNTVQGHPEYYFRAQGEVQNDAFSRLQNTRIVLLLVLGVAILLAIGFAWLVTQSIRRPLNGIVRTMEQIAAGDAQAIMVVDSQHEIGRLQSAAVAMIKNLKQDIAQRQTDKEEIHDRYLELHQLHQQLEQTQEQLIQSEKLASIGQLAAGVAHEINNPIGFVSSNMGALENYIKDLFSLLAAYEEAEATWRMAAAEDPLVRQKFEALQTLKQEFDLAFLRQDIPSLLAESREGITRVSKIVQDLRDFSRADTDEQWVKADLHACIDSTITIASNELKYRARVERVFGELPLIECLPTRLNQVFMNILTNAAQSMPEGKVGNIVVRTGCDDAVAWVEIEDDGQGMTAETTKCIFDPFFTTKPIGKGTGLGLSLSHGIIAKHGGTIVVDSEPGRGTRFRISLPQRHAGT